jgi:REP element-mobilizing transposase RayT
MIMRKVLGYMLTWTAYGNWLQGDKRRYVKNGQTLLPNLSLENANKANMSHSKVLLTAAQRKIIEKAILEEASLLKQKILASSVGKNHVHIVVDCNFVSAQSAVSHYKNAARLAVQAAGFLGRLWTKGYSVRSCFDEHQLQTVIAYVNRHKKTIT